MKVAAKRVFSLCLALCLALALAACGGNDASGGTRVSVDKKSAVMDHAEVLSEETETYVTNLSVALQETCGAQIGVYTVDYVGNNTTEGYAYNVFSEWGLGDKDKNNGILLLLAVGDDDYYVMRGSGLESQLSVSTLSGVLDDNMEPYWVARDYDSGTRTTVRTLTALLCNIYGLTMDVDGVAAGTATAAGPIAEDSGGGFPFLTVLLIILAIVLVVWLLGQASRSNGRPTGTPPPPPPPGGPMYNGGGYGYTAPRRSGFRDGLSSGIGFGIGQSIGRRMFGGNDRRPPSPPPQSRPPRPPRSGFGGMGGAGRSSGGGFRSSGGSGRSMGGGIRSGGGSFRAGGGSTRGGGAGRRP